MGLLPGKHLCLSLAGNFARSSPSSYQLFLLPMLKGSGWKQGASANAYLSALNKMIIKRKKTVPMEHETQKMKGI